MLKNRPLHELNLPERYTTESSHHSLSEHSKCKYRVTDISKTDSIERPISCLTCLRTLTFTNYTWITGK